MRALEGLGPRSHDIYMLFRIEKMKQRDIAALYGMTAFVQLNGASRTNSFPGLCQIASAPSNP